jgi:hypothetical protein
MHSAVFVSLTLLCVFPEVDTPQCSHYNWSLTRIQILTLVICPLLVPWLAGGWAVRNLTTRLRRPSSVPRTAAVSCVALGPGRERWFLVYSGEEVLTVSEGAGRRYRQQSPAIGYPRCMWPVVTRVCSSSVTAGCHVAVWEEKYMQRFWFRRLKERDHLEDLRIDGRIILKWVLKTWGRRAWIGFYTSYNGEFLD